ncbi:GNAT family N-acetyltransferase [Achromobacter anxifer]
MVIVRKLTPDLQPAYLDFFDRLAFKDNPEWSGCYCNCFYADRCQKPWKDWTAAENRAAVARLIQDRKMWGYLAFSGNQAVGWCGAGPKRAIPIFGGGLQDEDEHIGAITCFVVAPAFRKQGIARQLLRGALQDFSAMGLGIAEGNPRPSAETDAQSHFGPVSLFYSEGFEFHMDDPSDGSVIVRKRL